MLQRSLAVACLSLLLCLPVTSWGHARLVQSIPARGAVLSQAPTQVQLWFNEPLEVRFSKLSVWNAAGQRVDNGELKADSTDTRKLTVSLTALTHGLYTVKFRVLSVDSHIIENQFSFSVQTNP